MSENDVPFPQVIELSDAEQMVRLIADAGDPTMEVAIPERKRVLAEGVAQLIRADVWVWSTAAIDPCRNDAMATWLLDGGWRDAAEQGRAYAAMTNPVINAAFESLFREVRAGKFLTRRRDEFVSTEAWPRIRELWLSSGLEYNLFSMYPVGVNAISGVGFHRRPGKENFTKRERAIVHTIFQQVDWLHRHGTNEPASDKALQLSPRERQVLMLLLAGDSRSQIAEKLAISEHTVGDYMKQLHKHFAVNSRAELQAYFLAGGQ